MINLKLDLQFTVYYTEVLCCKHVQVGVQYLIQAGL